MFEHLIVLLCFAIISSTDAKNINVVLFLAHSDTESTYKQDDGLSYLNFSLVGTVKPCTQGVEEALRQDFATIIRYAKSSETKSCDCEKLLQASLQSILDWTQHAKGMDAAFVSLIKLEEGDGSTNVANCRMQTIDISSPHADQDVIMDPLDNIVSRSRPAVDHLPLVFDEQIRSREYPSLEREIKDAKDSIPIFNAYPDKLKFNDINKYHNKLDDFVNVKRVKRKRVIEPENTQVFEIDVADEEPNDIFDIPSLKNQQQPESIWDVLGIMSALKRSFFVNFLNPMLDPQQRMLEEEGGADFDAMGKVRAPSLFQLVQTTMTRLQENSRKQRSKGFLLVVVGENLKSIADSYSDLIQTIKHVVETTDPSNTLLIVTGNCPESAKHNVTSNTTNSTDSGTFFLPVYAKGPFKEIIGKAQDLSQIPLMIKESIQDNKTESNVHLLDLENVDRAGRNVDASKREKDNLKKFWAQAYADRTTGGSRQKRSVPNLSLKNGLNVDINSSIACLLNKHIFFLVLVIILGV